MDSKPGKGQVLTQEAFDELLAWLDPDREQAGRKYEDIRNRLIRILMHRGCMTAEDLADKTINLVARKAFTIRHTYIGDPMPYFLTVARNLYSEYARSQPYFSELIPDLVSTTADDAAELEAEYECLDKCLAELPAKKRELILEYHRYQEGAKIEYHKDMAWQLGIGLNALRIRMFRIRLHLRKCVDKCLATQTTH